MQAIVRLICADFMSAEVVGPALDVLVLSGPSDNAWQWFLAPNDQPDEALVGRPWQWFCTGAPTYTGARGCTLQRAS